MTRAFGDVSCGRCGKSFNALDNLHDEHPQRASDADKPDMPDTPPVLGDPKALASEDQLNSVLAERPPRHPDPLPQRAWLAMLGVLVLAGLLNLAWTVHTMLAGPGEDAGGAARIRLVSRDFHAHPTRPGVLVLSASFVSLAELPQPFPVLSITLLNADDRPLAWREFAPSQYLLAGVDHTSPLNPQVHVPILLEFADPGEEAVGFELKFH